MQSFRPILFQQPNGIWAKIAAIYDSVTGASTVLLSQTPPVPVDFSSAETSTDGSTVEVLFDGAISAMPVPAGSEFVFTADATEIAVTAVEVTDQDTLTLTLATPVANGETLDLSYTGTTLLSLNGAPVASFGPETVTNNVP